MKCIRKLRTLLYTKIAKMTVRSYGTRLRVNYFSRLGKNTVIGDFCNFNGMKIVGG